MAFILRRATSIEELEVVRALLREYAGYLNRSLGEKHICLDAYEEELASLPGVYAPPRGEILLAWVETPEGDMPAGCAALKPLQPNRAVEAGESACEMKRLWVTPAFRGQSIGRALADQLIDNIERFVAGKPVNSVIPASAASV